MRYPEFTDLHCSTNNYHRPHTWICGGATVTCDGSSRGPDYEQYRDAYPCCADPLCPCDYKPGWGPYAAPSFTYDLIDD